jgi:hypothetical protein
MYANEVEEERGRIIATGNSAKKSSFSRNHMSLLMISISAVSINDLIYNVGPDTHIKLPRTPNSAATFRQIRYVR